MRILFAGYSLSAPMGGGEVSARTLLGSLARHHDVEAVCVGRTTHEYLIGDTVRCRDVAVSGFPPPAGVPYHLAAMVVESQFRPTIVRHVQARTPDLLILQQPAYVHPRDLPEATKVVVFMRSLACYGAGEANPSRWRQLVGRPFRTARLSRSRALLDRADLVVSNSRFLQDMLRTRARVESEVVTPFIDTVALVRSLRGGVRDCLTFVGLDEWKGASLALRLAEALPDRRFLFLAGARASAAVRARAARLTNVTCLDWTPDMARVFDRTRILLMPSLWEEPFGRLPVEAGVCGIPTLASARGGLPESVGAGGVLIDPAAGQAEWIRTIERLDDPQLYASLAAAAQTHAESLSLQVTAHRFGELLERELQARTVLRGLGQHRRLRRSSKH